MAQWDLALSLLWLRLLLWQTLNQELLRVTDMVKKKKEFKAKSIKILNFPEGWRNTVRTCIKE